MNLFKKFFGKKKSHPSSIVDENNIVKGEGELEVSACGREYHTKVPITTTVNKRDTFYERNSNPDSCEREPNDEEIKIRIADITPKLSLYLGESIFDYCEQTSLKGYNNVILPLKKWNEACQKVEASTQKDAILNKVASNNLQGKELEKSGDIQGAIALYEENLATLYPACWAYERLMIIYHRLKDYENEKRVIKIAIQVFDTDNINNANLRIEQYPDKKPEILSALSSCTKLRGDDGCVIFNPVNVNKWRKRLEHII